MSKKFIVFAVILVVVVAPLSAWLAASQSNNTAIQKDMPDVHVQPATKKELLETLQTQRKESHFVNESNPIVKVKSVESYKRYELWWYVVNVTVKDDPVNTYPVIMSKFHDGPNTMRIYTSPGEPLPNHDISDTLGIPYTVIDDYNAALSQVGD